MLTGLVFSLLLSSPSSANEPKLIEPALTIKAMTSSAAIPDRRLVLGRNNRHMFAWNALTGDLIADAAGEGGAIEPRTGIAILGTEIWNLNEKRRLLTTGISERETTAEGISRDGHFAVIGGSELQLWNLQDQTLIGKIKTGIRRPSFLALSDDGGFVAVGRGAQFDVFDAKDGKLAHTGALAAVWPFRQTPTKGFSDFIHDHALDFTVIYEQVEAPPDVRQRPLWLIDWQKGKVNLFSDFIPGTGLIARPLGNTVEVSWAVEGSSQAVLIGHEAPVQRVAFSPDRWTIATGDKAGDVRVWDAYSGELLYRCRGGADAITSLNFSPDAQFLLAASRSEIRIYAISP